MTDMKKIYILTWQTRTASVITILGAFEDPDDAIREARHYPQEEVLVHPIDFHPKRQTDVSWLPEGGAGLDRKREAK